MTTKLLSICAALTALCLAAGCAAPTIPGSDEDFELDSKKPRSKGGNGASDDDPVLGDRSSSSEPTEPAPSEPAEPQPPPDGGTSPSTPTGVGERCDSPRVIGSVLGDKPSSIFVSGTGPQWLAIDVKDSLTIGFNVVPMIARFQLGGSGASGVELAILEKCGGSTITSVTGANEAQVHWSDYPGIDNSKRLLVQIRSKTGKAWVLDVDGGQ